MGRAKAELITDYTPYTTENGWYILRDNYWVIPIIESSENSILIKDVNERTTRICLKGKMKGYPNGREYDKYEIIDKEKAEFLTKDRRNDYIWKKLIARSKEWTPEEIEFIDNMANRLNIKFTI
jgi:hypothetical protein